MALLPAILITFVAVEHLYIMYMETIATTSEQTAKTFGVSRSSLENKQVQLLFKNQGVYNGLLALGLFYGAYISHARSEICMVLLIIIIGAALYGALTTSRSILLKQGGPAIAALIALLLL